MQNKYIILASENIFASLPNANSFWLKVEEAPADHLNSFLVEHRLYSGVAPWSCTPTLPSYPYVNIVTDRTTTQQPTTQQSSSVSIQNHFIERICDKKRSKLQYLTDSSKHKHA